MEINEELIFLPGDCFRIEHPDGFRIAQVIRTLQDGNLAVVLWILGPNAVQQGASNYYLPVILMEAGEEATVERPQSLASLVFMFNADSIEKFSSRYVYGMQNIFCIRQANEDEVTCEAAHFIQPSLQSLTHIINDSLNRISFELQRILSNRRQNQSVYSATNVPITAITWRYLLDYLCLPEVKKERSLQSVLSRSKDLSITQVKKKVICFILRVEDMGSIRKLISIFGISAVVGVRKRLPALIQRLQPNNNDILTARVAVQLLDVINIVDVTSNAALGPRNAKSKFAFNGNGYKGIDFIFVPELSSLRISVRYSCLVVQDALVKLNNLGISANIEPAIQRQRLTDEEIELFL